MSREHWLSGRTQFVSKISRQVLTRNYLGHITKISKGKKGKKMDGQFFKCVDSKERMKK